MPLYINYSGRSVRQLLEPEQNHDAMMQISIIHMQFSFEGKMYNFHINNNVTKLVNKVQFTSIG